MKRKQIFPNQSLPESCFRKRKAKIDHFRKQDSGSIISNRVPSNLFQEAVYIDFRKQDSGRQYILTSGFLFPEVSIYCLPESCFRNLKKVFRILISGRFNDREKTNRRLPVFRRNGVVRERWWSRQSSSACAVVE